MSHSVLYIAYPMRLDLGAANAIQTYSTVKELREIMPQVRLVVPRWLNEPSAFANIGALHLPRPAINKLSRLVPWAGWSYIERTLYSFVLVTLLMLKRRTFRAVRVLYVRDTVCAAWLGLLSPLHGARVVYEVHDLEARHPSGASRWPAGFWSRFLPWLDRVALRRACKVVSLTGTFRDWLTSRRLRPRRDVVVVPDAFDPALYSGSDTLDARVKLGLPESSFVVAYAGMTFAYRRLDVLVEAYALNRESMPDALLVLVGGRPDEVKALRNQAAGLGVDLSRVITPGQVPHERAALYVQAADVLVIPDTVTDMTASPLKLFEYMAAGKPTVLRESPALREIASDAAAVYFTPGDAGSLAAALHDLHDDREKASRMGRAARTEVARFTYRARAERIAEVIASCP